jgi:thymidylate synthase (FAD)
MQAKYVDHMGTDLSVVNAARVSFSKESALVDGNLSKGDTSLIQFLARGCTSGDWDQLKLDLLVAADPWQKEDMLDPIMNHLKNMPTHWTPFGHTAITLHMKAPLFVARQLGKHQVGLVWNEVSRRYVSDEPEFYTPEVWRKAAANVKQGSSDEAVDLKSEYVWCDDNTPKYGWDDYTLYELYHEHLEREALLYQKMLERGVCPEQARMVLAQSTYTEWYWTGNLYAFANVFIQRTDSHAQKETQEIAHQIGSIISPLFPVSWKALTQ